MKNKILFLTLLQTSPLLFSYFWFDIVPLQKLLEKNPQIQYHKCFDPVSFSYKPFPLSINPAMHPHQATFQETFILKIPNGQVQGYGMVLVNDQYIQELIWKGWPHNLQLIKKYNPDQISYIPGRVAVIGQPAYTNYFHWITEILARLALLEMAGIEYDYLYVPNDRPFIMQTLMLWGIDMKKIIVAQCDICLQAQEIIVPSLVSALNISAPLFSCYVQYHLIKYIKDKLLTAALGYQSTAELNSKVFVSRKDAPQRKIINEDAVFALFEKQGFVRYALEKLSVVDQILLFHNADIVVAAQGTGLANSIFCRPETKVIELYQGLNDCTFWYLSQDLNLNYIPLQTTTFLTDYYQAWATPTTMPLMLIQKYIDQVL